MDYMNNTIETYSVTLSPEDMATLLTCLIAGDWAIAKGADMGEVTTEWIDKVRTLAVQAMMADWDAE